MLKYEILNPALNELLGRVRHTNTLVISDLGFPYWPEIETVDISLVADMPSVLDVLRALSPVFTVGKAWMAEEFRAHNAADAEIAVRDALGGAELSFEPHGNFKQRVPLAIGLIRTGGSAAYSNIIIESA